MSGGSVIKYRVKFLDYWHIGSGVSGGAKFDSSVLKDKEGLPYIPGRTLKGLFREIAEEIRESLEGKEKGKYQKRIIDLYFGASEEERGEEWRGGRAHFSDAVVEEGEKVKGFRELLFDYIAGTQLENGIAKDHSLREVEVVVPLTLIGEVRGIREQDRKEVEKILIGLTRLGLKRHRGFGRCQVEIVKEDTPKRGKKRKKGAPKSSEIFLPLPPPNGKRVLFKVTLKGRVVVRGGANTEGKIPFLDFLPGSAIAGIVAQQFNSFKEPFKVFFSNQVKFGDGLPLNPANLSEIGVRPPLSYFTSKKEKERGVKGFYNLIHYPPEKEKEIIEKEGQLVQQRGGYLGIDRDGNYSLFQIPLTYTQKSAYDRERRRSRDGALYGYRSLPAGTQFIFPVEFGKEVPKEVQKEIEKILEGVHRIGKSKSAEYGLVEIEKIKVPSQYLPPLSERVPPPKEGEKLKDIPLYFLSRVALVDRNFQETLDPRWLLGPEEELEVDYFKSSLRFSSYFPFNQTRKYWDRERLVIEQGSVVVLKEATLEQLRRIEKGVGLYQNQGFGVVVVNPHWVAKKKIELKGEKGSSPGEGESGGGEKMGTPLINWLEGERVYRENLQKLVEEVQKLAPKFERSGLSISQWGRVRAIARGVDGNILKKLEGYLLPEERPPKIWKGDWELLEREVREWNRRGNEWGRKFVELLALEVQKGLKREKLVQKGEIDG